MFKLVKYTCLVAISLAMQGCNTGEGPLIADPKVLSITVLENTEPMMDLVDQSAILYGSSPEIPNNSDYTKIRKEVYARLIKAQATLPRGYRFCIYEGYRSVSLQKQLFEDRYQQTKRLHPQYTHQQCFRETTRLVSPVINLDGSINIPPHSTGGAFDIYLVDDRGHWLDMGIHPKDWMSDLDGSLSRTLSMKVSDEAQRNRRIMSRALTRAGFVNYPAEYWHWSYGDRYWAYQKGYKRAFYGSYDSGAIPKL
jgi:D-alanyl-D-alanine dipeptidase